MPPPDLVAHIVHYAEQRSATPKEFGFLAGRLFDRFDAAATLAVPAKRVTTRAATLASTLREIAPLVWLPPDHGAARLAAQRLLDALIANEAWFARVATHTSSEPSAQRLTADDDPLRRLADALRHREPGRPGRDLLEPARGLADEKRYAAAGARRLVANMAHGYLALAVTPLESSRQAAGAPRVAP